ncbi:2EXR domain-containing protein [Fusarium sp. Ph1]|nr:2EXR domain-containing protein [Fusarium sp. Ph1]
MENITKSVANMEPSEPYLELLNPKSKIEDKFHLFPNLPTEIRCQIWEQALCHERLIFIELHANLDPWTNTLIPDDYVITLPQRSTISKLFSVNAESRVCASRFYRVQLPCSYRCGDHVEENGILYFNAELDTLAISGFGYFVKFANDLWMHDPKRVGLVNVAIEASSTHHRFVHLYNDPKNHTLLRETLYRIKRVIFMSIREQKENSVCLRFVDCAPDSVSELKPHFSRPILGATPIFHRQPETRPVQDEIKELFIGRQDPRVYVHGWASLVAALGVQSDIEYKFMVAWGHRREQISNRGDAEGYVQEMNEHWKEHLQVPRGQLRQPKWLSSAVDRDFKYINPVHKGCNNVDQVPQPVVGFWLFPIECLGPLPRLSEDPTAPWRDNWYLKKTPDGRVSYFTPFNDLSEYLPELCISHL